jgi:hypothetical protein
MALSQPNPPALGAKQWEDLRGSDVTDVCRRAKVTWNPDGFYTVPFLDKTFRVIPVSGAVESDTGDPAANNPEFRLVLLCYLLLAKDITPAARWVSEKDLRGGSMFFTGPHALPAAPLIKQFGSAIEKFLDAGKKIGGVELPSFGDAAMIFHVVPRIECACVLWKEDEEFPARASFLFDPTADAHLTLDILTAMVRYLVKCLIKAATT